MKKFLYVKYVLAIVILGLLGFCTIYFVGNRQVQKHLESVYSGELYQEATTIAQSHDVQYFQNDEERDNQLYENLCTLASYRHCDVWIISPKGEILLNTASEPKTEDFPIITGFNPGTASGSYYRIGDFFSPVQRTAFKRHGACHQKHVCGELCSHAPSHACPAGTA